MAEVKTRKVAETVVKDAAETATVAVVIGALMREFGKGALMAFLANTEAQIKRALEDKRGEIVADIVAVCSSDTNGQRNDNLNLWYDHAKARNREAQFITLLAKLPPSKTDGNRQYVLKKINELDERGFERVLSQLDHDNLLQYLQRGAGYVERFLGTKFNLAEVSIADSGQHVKSFFSDAAPRIDNTLAGAINSLSDFIGGRR